MVNPKCQMDYQQICRQTLALAAFNQHFIRTKRPSAWSCGTTKHERNQFFMAQPQKN